MCTHLYYSKVRERTIKLHLRIPNGKTNYHVLWTDAQGKLRKASTSSTSKSEAKLFLVRFDPDDYEIKGRTKDKTEELLNANQQKTVSECFRDFLEYQRSTKKAKENTIKHHRTMINEFSRYASRITGSEDLPEISKKEKERGIQVFDKLTIDFFCCEPVLEPRKTQKIRELIEGFLSEKSHASARKYRNSLSGFYTFLFSRSIAPVHLMRYASNDIPLIVRFKATTSDAEFFTHEEIDKLIDGLKLEMSFAYFSHDLLRSMYLFATMTGLREKELSHLKWDDVHFDKPDSSYITVQRDSLTDFDTKSRLYRRIDLPEEAYQILWKRYVEFVALKDSIDQRDKSKAPPYVFYTHSFLKWKQVKVNAISQTVPVNSNGTLFENILARFFNPQTGSCA